MLSPVDYGREPGEKGEPRKDAQQQRDQEHGHEGGEAEELPVRAQEDARPDDRQNSPTAPQA